MCFNAFHLPSFQPTLLIEDYAWIVLYLFKKSFYTFFIEPCLAISINKNAIFRFSLPSKNPDGFYIYKFSEL